jgi:hypothetical protein
VAANVQQELQFTALDQNGYQDINQMDIVITPNGTSTNACFMVLFPQMSAIYVFDDNAVYWYPVQLNSGDSYSNSQCTVSGATYQTEVNPTTLGLNLWVTFLPAFAATSYFDEYVADPNGLSSGWVQLPGASITVTAPGSLAISSVSVLPSPVPSGGGASVTVALTGPAPSGGAVVTLSSSNPSAFPNAACTVAAGQISSTCAVTAGMVSSPTQVTLTATYSGSSQSQAVTVAPAALTVVGLTFSQSPVTSGNTVTVTVTLSGPAPAGGAIVDLTSGDSGALPVPASLTIAAGQSSGTTPPITAGTVSGQTPVQVGANNSYYETLVVNPPAPAQNFTLVTNYNYAPTSANANLSVPIATTCVNGFSGALEFTAVNYNSQYGQLLAGPPQFSSWSIPCGASSTLTIPVYSGAQPGNYNVTVWALAMIAGQPVQQSTTLGVTVTTSQAAGIVATPYAQTLAPGGAPALFQVGLIAVSNFSGTVTLSCGNSSLCTSASFSPLVLSGGVLSSIMTVSVAAGTAPGVYTIDVSGTSNGQPVSTNVQLTVSGPSSPGFTLQSSPFSWQITPGGSGSSTVTAAPANGFAGNVSLSCAGLPAGVTAGFAPNPITSATGYSGTLTLSAGAAVAAGTTANCTLTGTGGSAAATTLVQARVVAPANLISNVLTVSAPTKVAVPNNGRTLTAQYEFAHVPGDPYGDFSGGSCSTWDPSVSVWFGPIEGYNLPIQFYATGDAPLGELPMGETCICDDDSCFFDFPPVVVDSVPPPPMLQIRATATGANISGTTQSVLVGQRVDITAVVVNAGGATPTFTWAQPPGNTALNWLEAGGAYDWSSSTGPVPIPAGDLLSNQLYFAFTDTSGSGLPLHVSATLPGGGPPLTQTVTYNVALPTVTVEPVEEQSPYIGTSCLSWDPALAMCLYQPPATPGITFAATAGCSSAGSSLCEWVQIINNATLTTTPTSGAACLTALQSALDGGGPQAGGPAASDSPSTALPAGVQEQTDVENFSTFLMFKYNTNSLHDDGVWVPLYRVDWKWSGDAYLPGSPGTGWTFRTSPDPSPGGTLVPLEATSSYPTWTNAVDPNNLKCNSLPLVNGLAISPSQIATGASASITVTLSAPAPAGGATVNLSTSSGAFSAPATCSVPTGSTAGTCSGSAGVVTSSTPVTVTATYYSSTASATVTVVPQQ